MIGLAASTKYTGALFLALPAFTVAADFVFGSSRTWKFLAREVGLALLIPLAAAAVFAALNPAIIADQAGFLRDFSYEQHHMAYGHLGIDASRSTADFYLAGTLGARLGILFLAGAVAGVIVSFTGRNPGGVAVAAMSVIYIAAVVPFTVWMLRGFVAGVPADLEEAAMVDGLSRSKAFFKITFPLLMPGLVASAVYAFLQAWNEFTVALVLLTKDESATLPLWLRGFIQASATRETDWGQVMAASTLVAGPIIIFFMIVQGRMTAGLVSGAVKG